MENSNKVGQEQLYDLLTSKELSWQQIIYELIQTEQLDPWNIDIVLLAKSYIDKIQELEETSFYISSKILLAAAILLRIKSEILLKKYIRSLDDILYGKEAEKEKIPFMIDLEDVDLFPRTPLPRPRKVTLQELMSALNRAIETESRRIKKEISGRMASREASIVLPVHTFNIKEKIREIYKRILDFFKHQQEKDLTFSSIAGEKREEKIATFIPLLHLNYQEKIHLNQPEHFGEIYISMKQFKIETHFNDNETNGNELEPGQGPAPVN